MSYLYGIQFKMQKNDLIRALGREARIPLLYLTFCLLTVRLAGTIPD
jgi:hypothetical protein